MNEALKTLSTGESESKAFTLDGTDLYKILIGAVMVGAGAALTAITESVAEIDFGQWTAAVVAFWSTASNALRKLLAENKP